MAEIDDYKTYRRFPVELSHRTVMLIHLFNNENHFENAIDLENIDDKNNAISKYDREQSPANQFFKQLEGQFSDAFLEDIIIEATRLLVESDEAGNRIAKLRNDTDGWNRAKEALDKAESLILNKRNVLIEKYN